ncbi:MULTISPECIES: Cro/CI family transcriptional regulator [Shewanella]|jgi:DNA-binding transcriptional regulator YdaS (Cro superfamily)|uniref:Cro/CI family transcriptional regulator n=1 Tax=Shewanella TaxID=22 RepID=UPI0010C08CAE|nr:MULTISPECIES: Cro/CI family transcriptional regulator [unclassified Shewanella]MBB1363914.1 Cro/Cl family transcriptional regulator [Shewanella sp. SR44-4]QHS13168.1 Cro/Cl family transcriptional regulator [Shewanella sp. Arc9-LZ]|tara:strand:+ start:1971 stop:2156 length:186 start_codon:yes stop_codon:yes gene_type:complete
MKTKDAILYFGSKSQLAKNLGLTKGAISQWPDDVPELRAYQIERLTEGVLKADIPQLEQVS